MAKAATLRSVDVETDEDEDLPVADATIVVNADGSVVVDLDPPKPDNDDDEDFDENLAEKIDAGVLSTLSESLIEGIESDVASRIEWETTRTRGIELLGLKLVEPKGELGAGTLEGMSTVRHPVLLEAALRFWANACGELLPADGPAKIKVDGQESAAADVQATQLEKDFNSYLTVTDKSYYPDTKRMIWWVGCGGSGFKKVYHNPMKRRPVSESVDAEHLIVSNAAPDFDAAERITHLITMRPSVMKRMMHLGVYRDVALTQPTPQKSQIEEKKEGVEGVRRAQDRPEDQPYTLYECYCEVDLEGFAPEQFEDTGIPLPYRVTIDKDSREVLEVRRNWREEDEDCLRRKVFVKYPFVDAVGFYCIGLIHILGNSSTALTAAWRLMLDSGMFANFPGFAFVKQLSKQLTNEFRVPPGGGVPIDAPDGDIRKAIMALPYKDVSPGLLGLVDKIAESAQRVGMTAELPLGEGKQDAPVGTTLALIEQATKIESAVHKGLHGAQSEEFQLLIELLRENPEAFWRGRKKSKWTIDSFLEALDNHELVPVADPNTPTHMHRIAKAVAVKQLQQASPQLYDVKKVDSRIMAMIKVDDFASLFAPTPPPGAMPPDPKLIEGQAKLITAQTKVGESQAKAKLAEIQAGTQSNELAIAQSEQANKIDVETIKLATALVVHDDTRVAGERDHQNSQQDRAVEAQQQAHDRSVEMMQTGIGLRKQDLEERQHEHEVKNAGQEQINRKKELAIADKAATAKVKAANRPKPAKKKG